MNSRERLLAAKYGEKTDKIPVDVWWSEEIYKDLVYINKESPNNYYELDTRRFTIEMPLLKNKWHGFLKKEGDFLKIYEYPFPDINEAKTNSEDMEKKISEIKSKGFPAIGHIGSVCFEVACNLVGMEKLFISIYEDFDLIDELCQEITDIKSRIAVEFAKKGADVIHMGDDFGSQKGLLLSPVMWKRLFLGKIEKIISEVKEINKNCCIFFHSDGDISEIIDSLIDAGIDYLNPIQPECMDIYAISKRYAGNVSFWGGIGAQSTFYSNKENIFNKIKEAIEILGANNRYVIAPTHMLQGNVSLDNIKYFFEAVKYYGQND